MTTKNHGASGRLLSKRTIEGYALEFLRWRKEQGGNVRHAAVGSDRSLDSRTTKINRNHGLKSIDRIVSEMGAGRMWGGADYE